MLSYKEPFNLQDKSGKVIRYYPVNSLGAFRMNQIPKKAVKVYLIYYNHIHLIQFIYSLYPFKETMRTKYNVQKSQINCLEKILPLIYDNVYVECHLTCTFILIVYMSAM